MDEDVPAITGLAGAGAAARGASPQAAAAADGWDDAASALRPAQEVRGTNGLEVGQPALDLIVTLDDATSAILSAFLVEEEGTDSTFRALAEVFGRHGLPLSLYTDRGSHYFHTAEAGGKVDRACLTQVGRALDHLGVEHIAGLFAASPGPLGTRLPHSARPSDQGACAPGSPRSRPPTPSSGMSDVPAWQWRFAVEAEQEGVAFVTIPGVDLGEIFCIIQEERHVGNDNCVTFNRLKLQIPRRCAHFVKARAAVRHYAMTEPMRSSMGQDA